MSDIPVEDISLFLQSCNKLVSPKKWMPKGCKLSANKGYSDQDRCRGNEKQSVFERETDEG